MSESIPTWKSALATQKSAAYFIELMEFVKQERLSGKTIYPAQADVFNALKLTPLASTKVVILGQDPYHGPGQAHGLCFSVKRGVPPPPSLVNIFKECVNDVPGFTFPQHGELTQWAEQGVLLLNTVLTVQQGMAHSHANKGWEPFTDAVIKAVNRYTKGTVFMLWGSHARKKSALVDRTSHHILEAPHPSPLSAHRGFLGCKHFSQANTLLTAQAKSAINWCID